MKKFRLLPYCILFLFVPMILSAEESNKDKWQKENDSQYKYEQSDFTTFEYNPDTSGGIVLKGYTLSPGGAPDGYSYVTEKTVASGGGLNVSAESPQANQSDADSKFRRLQLSQSGSPTATLYVRTNNSPTTFNISMSGELTKSGNGTNKVSWNASVGTNFFWVDTPQEKVLTIAAGNDASASAHSPADSSYEKSTWKIIPSSGTTAEVNNAVATISSNTIFAYKPMFVNSTFQGAPAGRYQVEGTSAKDTSKKDNATWEIVQGDFYDNGCLNFDDYTGFEPISSYYSNNSSAGRYSRGRAHNVYIVKNTTNPALVKLNLTPSPISKEVSFGTNKIKQTSNFELPSPGTYRATLANELCTATTYQYSVKTKTIKVINVNGATGSISQQTVNSVNASYYTPVIYNWALETLVGITINNSNSYWTTADLIAIKSMPAYSSPPSDVVYVFIMDKPFTDTGVGGLVYGFSNHIFIFNGSPPARLLAHELGHTLGLEDKYTYTGPTTPGTSGTFTPGPDIDNLMNASSTGGSKFRQPQWTKSTFR